MIFGDIENGENVDFSRFYRTRYRTQNGGRGMGTTDMPFRQSNICSKNVNYAPCLALKYIVTVQYYGIFLMQLVFCTFLQVKILTICQVKMFYTCDIPE